uniref:Letm1 RBD domain-containing protein n=1 Tax=Romanomermis culicivorax TaxID=13658 RepID=A0A915JHQ8_ROMCU
MYLTNRSLATPILRRHIRSLTSNTYHSLRIVSKSTDVLKYVNHCIYFQNSEFSNVGSKFFVAPSIYRRVLFAAGDDDFRFCVYSQSRNFSTEKDKKSATNEKVENEKEDEGSLKVDSTLKLLKEEIGAGEREAERIEAAKKSAVEWKQKPLMERAKITLIHYYDGFKLFYIDLKVSTRLLWRVVRGNALSRQEKLQLIRSAGDLFRLVPFMVFIIVPLMEFLLPAYLYLFPNALPSQFKEKNEEDEKFRKQLRVKLEMAKFLQETVEELALERKKKGAADSKVAEFSNFLKNIREGGGYVSNVQLLKYSKLFEDELTLDTLSEAQLRALCRIVGITPLGTANILRFQLSMKLNELKNDDRLIFNEGVENLSVSELQSACRARGMRAIGLSEERLRQQLNQWLELSFNEKVPPSLLLLSSTLYLPEEVRFSDRLKALMQTLPVDLADEVKLKIAEAEGGSGLDNKSKFELIKSIEDILKRDRESKKALKKITAEEKRKKNGANGENVQDKAKDLSSSIDETEKSSVSESRDQKSSQINGSSNRKHTDRIVGDQMGHMENAAMHAQQKKDASS